MEEIISVFIYIHAFFGGLGLISGIGSIVVKKGSIPHKRFGKLFSIGMLVSSLISIPIACLPNHQNIFLLLIGLFTIYLVVSGNQVLTFKSKTKTAATVTDKITSGSMFFFSVVMILFGIYFLIKGNTTAFLLFVFFGGFGFLLSIKDFIFYRNLSTKRNLWLTNHVGKMIGAFIASVTAFLVAGLSLNNLIAWMLPTIFGTIYIVYWKRKLKVKN
ncbi:hypothetical protein LPB136_05205 [Tenacibaculum todarodis]|uniref:DUF2306 domain-containing protein n=1 Tax=Tenacibaculum todarodis TaxID=1850252 RepID=A0A1L3JI30_9FLAO|nr:hypothetical protein [Tenacibaculum todarodis]APG64795.1 hypothetical protein LPB136_05205 [Tenacibaculum todarodis]